MDAFLSRSIACLLPCAPADGEETRLVRPIGNGFMVGYAVDDQWVRQHHLARGATLADVHRQAMDNLFTLCAHHIRVQQFDSFFGVFIDGRFEASMFLLERLWQKDFASLVGQGYAIAAPARDVLAFCDIDSHEGKAELKRMIGRVWEGGDHLLSRELFRVRKKS